MFSFSTEAAIQWDHDCINMIGFNLYHDNVKLLSINCPDTFVIHPDLPDGEYKATAYNENGESEFSNTALLAGYYFNQTKYEYNASGQTIYRGEHTDATATDSDPNWIITKFEYDGFKLLRVRRKTSSWTDRATGW